MALFFTEILDKMSICGFLSITFEEMQQFISNFTKGSSITKYRSSMTFEVMCNFLTEFWPYFDLGLG